MLGSPLSVFPRKIYYFFTDVDISEAVTDIFGSVFSIVSTS